MRKATAIILSIFILAFGAGTFKKAAAETMPEPTTFLPQSTYLSPVKQAPLRFTGLGIEWHQLKPAGTSVQFAVRFKTASGWTDWNDVTGDVEGLDMSDPDYPTVFLSTEATDTLQYRVYLQTEDITQTPVIENLKFTYINSHEKVEGIAEKLVASIGAVGVARVATAGVARVASVAASTVVSGSSTGIVAATKIKVPKATGKIRIIPRSEWGADESLRLYTEDRPAPKLVSIEDDFYKKYADELKIKKKVTTDSNGKDLTWPLEYPEKVTKFVIHHTATSKNLDDPEQAIRDIYYFHAISRGWGDIGYNYIIDQKGNIYEGRYGGDGVVGAHAGRGNIGSIGIAVLGNFQENEVPDEVLNSLTALIKMKAEKYKIDPTGSSSFRGAYLPNIMGHRDIMTTACPGEKMYEQLPAIRLAVKGNFKPKTIDRRRTADAANKYDFSLLKNPDVLSFRPGSSQSLKLTLKNTGTVAWGPETHLVLSNDENARTFLASSSMVRSQRTDKEIAPGSSATFSLSLQSAYTGGITTLEIFPFIDGKLKVEKYISIPIQVEAPNYDYEYVKLESEKSYLKKGEASQLKLTLKNIGNTNWKRDGLNRIMIGTEKPRDHLSPLTGKPGTRLAAMQEREVKPGETGHFIIQVKAPLKEGTLREYFAPVIEGITWLPFKENYLEFYVYDTQYLARLAGVSGDKTLLPGASGKIIIEYLNAGGSVWKKADDKGFRIETTDTGLLKLGSPEMEQTQILPGQKAKLALAITAPSAEGTYTFNVTPKIGSRTLTSRPDVITVVVGKQRVSEQNYAGGKATADIRVDISFHSNPVISADGPFHLADGPEDLAQFNKNEKVSVTYDQGKYMVKGDKQAFALETAPRFEPEGTSVLRIDNFEHRPDWNKDYNDNEYRGSLEVHWYENTMHVVNELTIEDYLKGLAEISATDPYEKIKAVIVLARSYAYYYTRVGEKFPGAPYDLSDDPERSQKYLGYGFEKRNQTGVKAVGDTAFVIVTRNGKIIKTPYFSSDDGRTRSAEEVWGWKDTPWLVSVDDPGCAGKTLNGHGVGMSGCGAYYLASQGKTYEEIIKYYFQGVEVKKQK